jgi:hypothetical protein
VHQQREAHARKQSKQRRDPQTRDEQNIVRDVRTASSGHPMPSVYGKTV